MQRISNEYFFRKNNVLENDRSKYVVIKNWLDTELYNHTQQNNEKLNLLFLAWLEKDKGIFDLIRAIDIIVKNGLKNFELQIAGKGKDEKEAELLVKELNLGEYIKFYGWVLGERKMDLLANSEIFILPSYYEGSPNALLEAMASGNACITTGVGAIPDIIKNGNNGIISPKSNILELSKNISFLINKEETRNQMSTNAMEYVKEYHDIKVAIKQFEIILN